MSISIRIRKYCSVMLVLIAPLGGWLCARVLEAEPCNKSRVDYYSLSPCTSDYPPEMWCQGRPQASCTTSFGIGDPSGPSWEHECTYGGAPNDHCTIVVLNCVRKMVCQWDPVHGCLPGAQWEDSWFQSYRAVSPPCTPGEW